MNAATKGGDGAGGPANQVYNNTPTDGGPGIYSDISGINIGYGGGGGGRDISAPEQNGYGVDGGATTARIDTIGNKAFPSRGGGGASENTSGGSGVVIIRYKLQYETITDEIIGGYLNYDLDNQIWNVKDKIDYKDIIPPYIKYNVPTITPTVIPEKIDNEFNVLTFTYDNNYNYITELQVQAETITSVLGWELVRHLPSGTTQYYSGDDNFTGTFLLNENSKLENEEWSIGYNSDYDEILMIRGNFTEWLYINRSDTTFSSTWTDRTSIATNYGSETSYRYFNDGRTSAPWFYSQATYTETKIVFHEDVNSGGHSSGLNGDSFNMFVRKSSYAGAGSGQKEYELTFDNPALCDILMIGGGGGGATDRAGGGGAGSLLFYKNFVMKGTYKIKVGKGGKGGGNTTGDYDGYNGYDSEISSINNNPIFKVIGGGGGGFINKNGKIGGCGGGSGSQSGNVIGGNTSFDYIINSDLAPNTPNVETDNYVYYANIGGRNIHNWVGNNLGELDGAGGGGIGEGGTLTGLINSVDAQQYDGGKGGDGKYRLL